MSDQAWDQLVDLIDQKYQIAAHRRHTEEIDSKDKLKRLHDEVEFLKGGERYRIDRVSSPAVTDTKTHYVHRGAAHRVEHTYDPSELVHKVVFYKQAAGGSWHEIQPESLL